MKRTVYIAMLPDRLQKEIRMELTDSILNSNTEMNVREIADMVQNGMDSRLCDLEDVIDIEKYIDMEIEDL